MMIIVHTMYCFRSPTRENRVRMTCAADNAAH
jgi:hypothetical protein